MGRAGGADDGDDEVGKRFIVRATVKWFDSSQGYGFLEPVEGDGPDIMVHITKLQEAGHNELVEGATVLCEVESRSKGLHAVNIIEVDFSTATPRPPRASGRSTAAENALENDEGGWRRAATKWFNAARGFGFVNATGLDGDIFVHIEILRKGGLGPLEPGDVIEVRSAKGKRGWVAVEARVAGAA